MAAALVLAWRRRDRIELALAGVVVAWVALVAVMTQSGFSGNARYLLPATVVACLLTGTALGHLLRSGRRSVPAAVAAVALVAWSLSRPPPNGCPRWSARRGRPSAPRELDRDLGIAVARMGGADAVVARGAPAVDRAFIPRMAWLTTLPIGQVERRSRRPGPGVRRRPARPGHAGRADHAGARAVRPAGGRALAGLRARGVSRSR